MAVNVALRNDSHSRSNNWYLAVYIIASVGGEEFDEVLPEDYVRGRAGAGLCGHLSWRNLLLDRVWHCGAWRPWGYRPFRRRLHSQQAFSAQ